jgi:predicted O-methyltransferase YrrM
VLAEVTAREIGRVTIAEALELTALVARKEPHRHPRVAARWLLRYLGEHAAATIEEAGVVAACLHALGNPGHALDSVFMQRTLRELASEHGTDKARSGLAAIYEPFLKTLRDEPVSVLEIGVLEGASLRMWRDYFPAGRIVGIDLSPQATEHEADRIKVIIGDQTDAAVMDAAVEAIGPFDLVVDDGGHYAYQQICSLLYLWPHVKPGGIYVVEDTHASYLAQFDMSYRNPASAIELLKGTVDDVGAHWHTHPVTLEHLDSVHFFNCTCVLRKQKPLVPRTMWAGIGKKTWDF